MKDDIKIARLRFHIALIAIGISILLLWNGVCDYIYDGVDAPPTASMCQSGGVEHHLREASVSEVSIIGLDIA
ncbi:MAG: hypothetical protein P8Y71_27840, partial [Pseudolabrys sp.]